MDEERLDDVSDCFCADGTFSFPMLDDPVVGHEALRAFFAAHVGRFSSHVDRVTRVIVSGDQAISKLVFDATTNDGRPVHLENCNVYEFRGGKFAHARVYADSYELRRQFGID